MPGPYITTTVEATRTGKVGAYSHGLLRGATTTAWPGESDDGTGRMFIDLPRA